MGSAHSSAGGGVCVPLPEDVLREVLLRLPAKELCRLRAVCRSWRSLTSDPTFIAAHNGRHPETLVVCGVSMDSGVDILVMDLSGKVLKRIRTTGSHMVLPTKLDLVCVVENDTGHADVINPATGVVRALPKNMAAELRSRGKPLCDYFTSFVFGRIDTGEYKVLRVLTDDPRPIQIFEVLTLGNNGTTPWRAIEGVQICVRTDPINSVVVKGVVYFLLVDHIDVEIDCLARFDLKTEKWMSYLQGPLSSNPESNNTVAMLYTNLPVALRVREYLTLAELNDFLVLGQYTYPEYPSHLDGFCLDLWYLMDLESCLWERKYRIDLGMGGILDYGHFCAIACPFSVLHDGRLLLGLFIAEEKSEELYERQMLGIYDPETKTLSSDLLDAIDTDDFGLYTGSLLSVRNGDEL